MNVGVVLTVVHPLVVVSVEFMDCFFLLIVSTAATLKERDSSRMPGTPWSRKFDKSE